MTKRTPDQNTAQHSTQHEASKDRINISELRNSDVDSDKNWNETDRSGDGGGGQLKLRER
jgi:hypothetical protein